VPILDERSLEFLSHSPQQTQRVGVRMGELLPANAVLLLQGDLGAGKTTLAQGIARGWGSLDPVTSPTFVLINEYRRADNQMLYHVDAFRLKDSDEAELLGLEELLLNDGPVMIEWPERIERLLPEQHLKVELYWADESRRNLQFHASGAEYEALLREFRRSAFGG
jgi:tRNA threonylcarbamoyladenosine biosynthesis protein TsaE